MTVLKHELDSDGYATIPENLRPMYAEVEGSEGNYAIPEGLRGVADAMTGLFSANKKARDDVKAWERKGAPDLSDLSDYGDDFTTIKEGVKAKIAELESSLAKGAEGKVDLDKVRTEMKAAHAKDLKAKDDENQALRGTVHKYLALPFAEKHMKVVEQDGEFNPVVVDADGDVRISGGTGLPMTPKELIKEMRAQEKYAPLFKSQAKTGGGALPGRTGAAPQPTSGADASPIDKIKSGLKKRAA